MVDLKKATARQVLGAFHVPQLLKEGVILSCNKRKIEINRPPVFKGEVSVWYQLAFESGNTALWQRYALLLLESGDTDTALIIQEQLCRNYAKVQENPFDRLKSLGSKATIPAYQAVQITDDLDNLKLADLYLRLSAEAVEQIRSAFDSSDSRANCCRWLLRGLPFEMAVRKVRIDNGTKSNLIPRR